MRHSVYKCLEQTAVCNMWHTFTFTLSFDSSLYFIYFHFTSPAWVNVCQASTSCWMTAWYRTDINYYSFSTWQVSQYLATKADSTVSSPPSFSFLSLIFSYFPQFSMSFISLSSSYLVMVSQKDWATSLHFWATSEAMPNHQRFCHKNRTSLERCQLLK